MSSLLEKLSEARPLPQGKHVASTAAGVRPSRLPVSILLPQPAQVREFFFQCRTRIFADHYSCDVGIVRSQRVHMLVAFWSRTSTPRVSKRSSVAIHFKLSTSGFGVAK